MKVRAAAVVDDPRRGDPQLYMRVTAAQRPIGSGPVEPVGGVALRTTGVRDLADGLRIPDLIGWRPLGDFRGRALRCRSCRLAAETPPGILWLPSGGGPGELLRLLAVASSRPVQEGPTRRPAGVLLLRSHLRAPKGEAAAGVVDRITRRADDRSADQCRNPRSCQGRSTR